jgi:hypothetical protein
MKLNFYTTSGCHLCEQALQVIAGVQVSSYPQLQLTQLDIADDDLLIEKYGIRIPVIQIPATDYELGWPFDGEAVTRFLEQAP